MELTTFVCAPTLMRALVDPRAALAVAVLVCLVLIAVARARTAPSPPEPDAPTLDPRDFAILGQLADEEALGREAAARATADPEQQWAEIVSEFTAGTVEGTARQSEDQAWRVQRGAAGAPSAGTTAHRHSAWNLPPSSLES